MGDSGPDATSLAKPYPGDKPAGSGGGLSAPGNGKFTSDSFCHFERGTISTAIARMSRLRHNIIIVNELQPINLCLYLPLQVEVCRSQHTNGWLSALYVYKGLLLVVGVYMAWETR